MKPVIIVVDDTLQTLRLIEKMVGHVCPEYDVIAFDSASDVLTYVETDVPSLIISDIQMPDVNGYDLMEAIYAQYDVYQLPMILLSSWANHDNDAQIQYLLEDRNLPIVPIACKPINLKDLHAKILKALAHQVH